jgi:hypothetical protein
LFYYFGEDDPRKMPPHFFWRCVSLDYDSAIRADITRQDYSVVPRHWYIDAKFRCDRCQTVFGFSAQEQKVWYEGYGFWVDSCAKQCRDCRRELRDLKALRQEYDREIARALTGSSDLDLKIRIAAAIDHLLEAYQDSPIKVCENRKLLARQIARRTRPSVG